MYYELYIDVLFLVNFLMDYLLLLIAKRLLKNPAPYGRICLGALTGSLLTCLLVAARMLPGAVRWLLGYTLVPLLMAVTGLRLRKVQACVRAIITLFISGIILGGIFEQFSQYVEVGSLFFALAVGSYYLAAAVLKVLSWLIGFGEAHCHVTLYLGEKRCEAEAIIDTGNHLTDRVSGKGVTIISRNLAGRLFEELHPDNIRYIPYRTIGKGSGVLPVIAIDGLCVDGVREQWFSHPVIGISEDSSFGNGYDVILNPDI